MEDNASVELFSGESVGATVLLYGAYEQAERQYARTLISAGTTVIDAGANVGVFSVWFSNCVGPDGSVLAIEPTPNNQERLQKNLRLSNIDNVIVHGVAAGSENGETILHLSTDPAFSSTQRHDVRWTMDSSLRVPVRTLDAIWRSAGMPHISLIKVDIEGGELDVLKGAADILSACRPAVLIEANTVEERNDIQSWIGARGYRLEQPDGFKPQNVVLLPD
jgi:FkbM family methyltransferase